jgi:hypothetical protein
MRSSLHSHALDVGTPVLSICLHSGETYGPELLTAAGTIHAENIGSKLSILLMIRPTAILLIHSSSLNCIPVSKCLISKRIAYGLDDRGSVTSKDRKSCLCKSVRICPGDHSASRRMKQLNSSTEKSPS